MQPVVEFQTPPGQTIAVNALAWCMVQPATETTAYIFFDSNQVEVMGDYDTVKNKLETA